MNIQITHDYNHPAGFMVWRGDVHSAMSSVSPDGSVEVKIAGEYITLPSGVFEVI